MTQSAITSAWVKESEHGDWGFDRPDPNLVKVVLDLRPKRSRGNYNPPPVTGSSSMSSFLKEFQNARTEEQKANYEKFQKEHPPSDLSSKEFHPLVSETGANRYFGGPILDKNTMKWRETNHTRDCGEVIGAKESGTALPSNISCIVKSVAVMSSRVMTQTAIWMGETFHVESKICSQVVSEFSPKVQLIEFSAEHDIGLFKLQDHYPSRTEYVDPDWLMSCDEVYRANLENGRNVACVGYSSKISPEDEELVWALLNFPAQAVPMNLDIFTKPSMKSFAPGTLDKVEARSNILRFGVSASLWKGSCGGPCILLAGTEAGKIIGLVRGYDLLSDPYNIVNGFPDGLKELIKRS